MKKRLSCILFVLCMVFTLLPFSTLQVRAASLSAGQRNIVARAYQQVQIPWTPLKDVKGFVDTDGNLTGTFKKGVTYRGMPYGQLIESGRYVPHNASFDTFLAAVRDENSVFYTQRGKYGTMDSTYYGSDCSAFVSYAYGISRTTTVGIASSSLFTQVTGGIYAAEVGDCYNRSGYHVVLITGLTYDSYGNLSQVEVSEQTPPKARTVTYSVAEMQSKYASAGYKLLRFNNRDQVSAPIPYSGEDTVLPTASPEPTEQNPVLDFSVTSPEPGKLHVSGFAFDREDSGATLRVDIYIGDECIGSTYAGYYRPDVNSTYGCGDYHGIDATFCTAQSGMLSVSAAAINPADGRSFRSEAKSVTVMLDSTAPTLGSVTVSNLSTTSFALTASASDNVAVKAVKFAVWNEREADGAAWYDASLSGDKWTCTVSRSAAEGAYYAEAFVYDLAGNDCRSGAQIAVRNVTVSFDLNGGTGNASGRLVPVLESGVGEKTTYGALPSVSRSGYVFDGWYTAATGGTKVTETTPITAASNHTLYAHWKQALRVLTQPKDASGTLGAVLTFTVSAEGSGLTYQWQYSKDGGKTWLASSSRSTTATCTLSTAERDGWIYRCVIKDAAGNAVISGTAKVIVKPSITAQPKDASGALGDVLRFTVAAAGKGLTYQWQYSKDGGRTWLLSSSKSTSATCTLNASSRDGWLYRCIVKSSNGLSATSNTAKVSIRSGPVITMQPKDASGVLGEVLKFTVGATGTGLSYQWQYSKDGGKTWLSSSSKSATATCTLTSEERHGWLYRCIVMDSSGSISVSRTASVTVFTGLVITSQPKDAAGHLGEKVSFAVGVSGDGLSYRWQYSADGGKTWQSSSSRSASATCTLTSAERDGWLYRCIVMDSSGNVVLSGTAKVIVLP